MDKKPDPDSLITKTASLKIADQESAAKPSKVQAVEGFKTADAATFRKKGFYPKKILPVQVQPIITKVKLGTRSHPTYLTIDSWEAWEDYPGQYKEKKPAVKTEPAQSPDQPMTDWEHFDL